MYSLVRLNKQTFEALLAQWKPHFDGDEHLLYEHCRPHLEHAQRVCEEDPCDPRYGIFGLVNGAGADIVYEGFAHLNHKLPKTPDAELRLVWNTLHPRYETALTAELLAAFTVAYITEAIRLAKSEFLAHSVRIHLGNATDRDYARGIVATMRDEMGNASPVDFAGNWLHIKDVSKLEI